MIKLSRFVLKLFGWEIVTTSDNPKKSIICIAPHTSNWDFILGQLYNMSEGRAASFFMKKSWFFFPLGAIFRKIGGVPVDRSVRNALTQQMVDLFESKDIFHLAITPEGTRGCVQRWKMGFYYIALGANVPIELAYMDYAKKEVGIKKTIYPSGNMSADMKQIFDCYKTVTACHPEKFNIPKYEDNTNSI